MYKPTITFTLNQSLEAFLKKNGLNREQHVSKQPSGLGKVVYKWPAKQRGEAYFDYGEHSFTIPLAMGYTGRIDFDKQQQIIDQSDISIAFSQDGKIMHDEALKHLTQFVRGLEAKGWKRSIYRMSPRLSGKEAVEYYKQKRIYILPSHHNLSLQDWMDIDVQHYSYFANRAHLNFTVRRNKQRKDLSEPGEYFMSMTIEDSKSIATTELESQNQEDWEDHEKWRKIMKRNYFERYKTETLLEAKGYTIDRSYQDPIIHPADPVEFDPETYVPDE